MEISLIFFHAVGSTRPVVLSKQKLLINLCENFFAVCFFFFLTRIESKGGVVWYKRLLLQFYQETNKIIITTKKTKQKTNS